MGEGILQSFNINELAGATGLILGALGGLLAVIWKSRCHCKMNLCYLCQCERRPPPDRQADSSDEEEINDHRSQDDSINYEIGEDGDTFDSIIIIILNDIILLSA